MSVLYIEHSSAPERQPSKRRNLKRRGLIAAVVFGASCSLLGGLLWTGGCSSAKKDTAEAAVATSSADYAAMREEAVKYSPAQAASVESALKSAKASLAKGDYSTALTLAKDIPSQIQELSASVKDRKDELKEDWEELSAAVPALIRANRSRIDSLSRARRVPAGAREMLATAQKQWQNANNFYTSEELLPAVNLANETKDALVALQSELAKPEK